MTEYGCKIKEEVKAIHSEIKIYREPTVKGRKLGLKSMIWNKRKQKNNLSEQEEKRIQKMRII